MAPPDDMVKLPRPSSAEDLGSPQRNVRAAAQRKYMDRLTSVNRVAGVPNETHVLLCADGITRMPYTVLGKLSVPPSRCNFVVVHDLFDTLDATALLFKPILNRHLDCQVRLQPTCKQPPSSVVAGLRHVD